MSFQTKSFVALVASMVNRMRRTTLLFNDYEPGSVARTLIEAPAQEIDELYQQMVRTLIDAIPVSVYNSFNFAALPPLPTPGTIRVVVTASASPVTTFAGTTFTLVGGSSISYTSTADVVIPAGSTYGDVYVVASVAGISGNIPSGQLFTASPSPTNFVSASNLAAFVGGADAESADGRKTRFQAFVSTLSKGTVDAVQYGALTTLLVDSAGNVLERVRSALVVEPYLADQTQPPALIFVYVHNGVGSTSAALVAQAQQVVNGYRDPITGARIVGWKAAGVQARVVAATDQAVNVTGILTPVPGQNLTVLVAAVNAAIKAYIGGLPIGAPYMASQVAALVLAVPGASNWQPSGPLVDVLAASNVKLIPGTVTVIALALSSTMSISTAMGATLV